MLTFSDIGLEDLKYSKSTLTSILLWAGRQGAKWKK